MRKTIFIIGLSLILGLFVTLEVSAQQKIRVRFAKGKVSKTVKGSVTGYEYKDYLVNAGYGQTLAIELDSGNSSVEFVVLGPNGEDLGGGETEYFTELESSGDFVIRVLQPRAEARRKRTATFSMTIIIE